MVLLRSPLDPSIQMYSAWTHPFWGRSMYFCSCGGSQFCSALGGSRWQQTVAVLEVTTLLAWKVESASQEPVGGGGGHRKGPVKRTIVNVRLGNGYLSRNRKRRDRKLNVAVAVAVVCALREVVSCVMWGMETKGEKKTRRDDGCFYIRNVVFFFFFGGFLFFSFFGLYPARGSSSPRLPPPPSGGQPIAFSQQNPCRPALMQP